MVCDTWSTDVLASDTETTMGKGDDRIISCCHRVHLPDELPLGVDSQLSTTSSNQGAGVAGVGGGASSIASSPTANLLDLDVAETASEALLTNVLGLAELDNEDTGGSMADSTRR